MLCKYGCDQLGTKLTRDGNYICANSPNSCPEIKRKKAIKGSWLQTPEGLKRFQEDNIKKFGFKNPMQNPEIRNRAGENKKKKYPKKGRDKRLMIPIIEKFEEPHLCKYGCGNYAKWYNRKRKQFICSFNYTDCPNYSNWKGEMFFRKTGKFNPFQLDSVKKKLKETMTNKYGDTHPLKCNSIKDRIKKTCLERYGVENPFERTDIIIASMQAKYGVDNPMHHAPSFDKCQTSGYRLKKYVLPSGKIIWLQGNEPKYLNMIFSEGFNEDDIEYNKKKYPTIFYIDPIKNRKRRYYPDFFIPTKNLIIEVKSKWTYYGNEKNGYLSTNKAKQEACISLGYEFRFVIL